MSQLKNQEYKLPQELIYSLDSTTKLVHQLLQDIREGELNLNSIKVELAHLIYNLKIITESVKENEKETHELLTRVVLLEKIAEELKEDIKPLKLISVSDIDHITQKLLVLENEILSLKKQKEEEKAVILANKTGKWQLIVAFVTGILALIATGIASYFNLKK